MGSKIKEYDIDEILFYWAISKDYSKRLKFSKDRREKLGKKLFYNDYSNFITYLFLDSKRDKSAISYKFIGGFLNGFITKIILTSKNKDNIEINSQYITSLVLDKKEIDFLKLYPEYKLHDIFLVIDNSKLNAYLNEYLDEWYKQKLKRKNNTYYRTPQNHLNIFLKEIYRKYQAYGIEIPYDLLDLGNDFDNITPLLYIERKGYIKIDEYPDLITGHRFHIQINDSFFELYNDFFDENDKMDTIIKKGITITLLTNNSVSFNNEKPIKISPGEYDLMEKFKNTKSGKLQVDLLLNKPNKLGALKKAQVRFNKKSMIKIKKVHGKHLWYLERHKKDISETS